MLSNSRIANARPVKSFKIGLQAPSAFEISFHTASRFRRVTEEYGVSGVFINSVARLKPAFSSFALSLSAFVAMAKNGFPLFVSHSFICRSRVVGPWRESVMRIDSTRFKRVARYPSTIGPHVRLTRSGARAQP